MTAPVKSSAELADWLGASDTIDPQAFVAKVEQYVQQQVADGIGDKVAQAVQAGLADFARQSALIDGARPNITGDTTGGARVSAEARRHYNGKAAGAVLDGKFDSLSDFFATLRDERRTSAAATKLGDIRNAFSSASPSEGGFLIPEEYRAEILRIALENGITRRAGARVIPMSVPKIHWPVLDATSNAAHVHGGVTAYWTEEAAALTPSSPSFARIALEAHKLTARADIPNELLADSAPSIGPLVDEIFPEGVAYFEDDAYVNGTGVGQPLGWRRADATVTVAKETSQAANTILWANIVKMYSRMLPTSLGRAVWIANNDILPQLLQMTLPVKNVAGTENVGGSAVGISYDQGSGAPIFTLLGRPILLTEKVPTLGTVGDLSFVDMRYYLIGDRQQISAQTSEHYQFANDMTTYRIITRVDGRPGILSALTPRTGSNTVSPFVNLATRS